MIPVDCFFLSQLPPSPDSCHQTLSPVAAMFAFAHACNFAWPNREPACSIGAVELRNYRRLCRLIRVRDIFPAPDQQATRWSCTSRTACCGPERSRAGAWFYSTSSRSAPCSPCFTMQGPEGQIFGAHARTPYAFCLAGQHLAWPVLRSSCAVRVCLSATSRPSGQLFYPVRDQAVYMTSFCGFPPSTIAWRRWPGSDVLVFQRTVPLCSCADNGPANHAHSWKRATSVIRGRLFHPV